MDTEPKMEWKKETFWEIYWLPICAGVICGSVVAVIGAMLILPMIL